MQRALTFISDVSDRFSGKAFLYKVDPPVEYLISEENSALTPYIIASSPSLPMQEPRIYLFPSDENGKLIDWTELMSWKGRGDIDAVVHEWAEAPLHKLTIQE